MPTLILAVAGMLLTTTALAATVHGCESEHRDLDRIGNLIGNVRDFAEGAIRVAYVLYEVSDVSSTAHLLIFVYQEPRGYGCYAVSANAEGIGFSSIDMDGLKATYDSNKGLLISVPVRSFDSTNSVRWQAG